MKQQFDIYAVDSFLNNGRSFVAHPHPTILLGGLFVTTVEADSAAHAVFIHVSSNMAAVKDFGIY